MKKLLWVAVFVFGCGGTMGHLGRIELDQQQVDQDNPGPPVHGEDCSFTFMGNQSRSLSPRQAVIDALERTGSNQLVSVDVSIVERGIWLFGERCVRVEGRLP